MREKLILKRLELERTKESKRIDARINSQVDKQNREETKGDVNKSKSRKKNDEIMNKIVDFVELRNY